MSLSTVPPDITRYISQFGSQRELLTLIQTSPSFHRRLESEYRRRICSIPITGRELSIFFNSRPRWGYIAWIPSYLIEYSIYDPIFAFTYSIEGSTYLIRTGSAKRSGEKPIEQVNRLFINRFREVPDESRRTLERGLDLLTQGIILSQRERCRQIQPDFVINRLRSNLELLRPIADEPEERRIYKRLAIRMNSRILGIPDIPEGEEDRIELLDRRLTEIF